MRYGKECVCGRGAECKGVSAAFSLLKDPRRGYVALPPYYPYPECYEDKDMNAMRASYLRHLNRTEASLGDSSIPRFVALHHFHPLVVQKHSEMVNAVSPIPKTVKKVDLRFLKIKLGDEDRVRNERGHKIKKFYFVPTVSLDETKEHLKHIIRVSRLYAEAKSGLDPSPGKPVRVLPPGESSKEDGELSSLVDPDAVLQNEQKPPALPSPATTQRNNSQDTLRVSSRAGPDDMIDTAPPKPRITTTPDRSVSSKSADPLLDLVVDTEIDKFDTSEIDKFDINIDETNLDKQMPQNLSEQIYDKIWPEEILPSNMAMQSEEGRKFLFSRMCKFEGYRYETCIPIIDEFHARWRACLTVMQAGIFETARAERLIRGNAMANKAYSDAMHAMHDDVYLDENGQIVPDIRKQKKLAKDREGIKYSIASDSVLLGPIVDSQAVLAEKFALYGDVVTQEVVTELSNLRSYLKAQILEFKRRGDPLIRNIQESETEINGAFSIFEAIGAVPSDQEGGSLHSKSVIPHGSFHGSYHSGMTSPAPSTVSSNNNITADGNSNRRKFFPNKKSSGRSLVSNAGDESVGEDAEDDGATNNSISLFASPLSPLNAAIRGNVIVRDGWLAEMLYRQAVNSQITIMKKCGAALEKISQAMREIEVNRQVRLHQALLDFLPRQRRLYLGLTPITESCLNGLVKQRVEKKELEKQVEEAVKQHMQYLLREDNAQRSSIMNRSRARGPDLDDLHGVLTGEFFDNGLLRAAGVLELKTSEFFVQNWKTTLVVITTDAYLHMFDLTGFPEVFVGSPPECVFEMLLPDYDLPTLESDSIIPRTNQLLKYLTPETTIRLATCSVTKAAYEPGSLEIKGKTETNEVRKFKLRAPHSDETDQWITLLRSFEESTPEGESTGELTESMENLVFNAAKSADLAANQNSETPSNGVAASQL
mmetsp:Transcript_20371/g.30882  ORF Transcript_20371/g.30882 Transcript_20371/m.30882 type:complete len:935 (+) Transcript_20371:81-2885(+)